MMTSKFLADTEVERGQTVCWAGTKFDTGQSAVLRSRWNASWRMSST